MPLLFLDFETYYDKEYSLKKMPPPNYILDKRFETIGCAAKVDDGPQTWIDGPDFPKFISQFDPAKTTTVAFNALFDNCILAWRFGFVPARLVCTMRMAVALRGHLLRSASLASVGACLGVGTKGNTIESVVGLHRRDIMANPGLWRAYQAYALNDNDMSEAIFWKLMPEFPANERRIMDRVLRCAVEPKFIVDTALLTEHLADLETEKARLLSEAGITDPTNLRSTQRFEAILKARGVDIEYRQSTTDPDKKVPCFAKTDEFMERLQEHDDPVVQALAAARLGLRSTIEQSRGTRILSIASLDWASAAYRGGNMPIPLRYAGAHTHRLSGDWLINMQNLPSGRGQQKSKLRKSLIAPPGQQVVVADKSQIECRINGWFCGQNDLLDIFRRKGDPYSVLGSAIFGFEVDKNVHKLERFIGKTGVLGLGFGCGADKFYNMVVRSGRILGMDMKKLMSVWSPQLAQKSVTTYRQINGAIQMMWHRLDDAIGTAWIGNGPPMQVGPVIIGNDGKHAYVEGPFGLRMNYANPRYVNNEYWYDYGRTPHKMYGSKLLENIVQFLARIDTMNDALRISDRGHRFVLQSHDELVWLTPAENAQACLNIALEEMRRPPSWAPTIPLDAEGNFGNSYADAK